ncbi:MAG: Nramp family divalent metal transporter, partial [Planctomycetaceae bacterium]
TVGGYEKLVPHGEKLEHSVYANESGIQREQRPKQGDSAPLPPGRRHSLTAPAAQQADLTWFPTPKADGLTSTSSTRLSSPKSVESRPVGPLKVRIERSAPIPCAGIVGESLHHGWMRSIIESTSDVPAETPAAPTTVSAGHMPPWEVGTLDAAPVHSWRNWTAIIGPGILLAGSSIGAGEWLLGPEVTAKFGGTFLWLATISIVTQAFYNLEVMRYTLYCGEPIFVGFFRVGPGPKFWTGVYLLLCIAHIWPFMASNAAVPLSAAILGHLPSDDGKLALGPFEFTENDLVKRLGYAIFLIAFLPLIFGGKIYNVIERMMTLKLIIVLGFLVSVTGFLTSSHNAREVVTGFFRFGQIALRAETVVAGPHFTYTRHEGATSQTIAGTFQVANQPQVTALMVDGKSVKIDGKIPADYFPLRDRLLDEVRPLATPGQFLLETSRKDTTYRIQGTIGADAQWTATQCTLVGADGHSKTVTPEALSSDDAKLVHGLVANQGFERVGIIGYFREHGTAPPLDWPLLAAFAAIAGAGMLSNALFSNYARDKGWGMGAKTGAIPSAIGGRKVSLSHVGKVFVVDDAACKKWKGWFRHILRDQVLWIVCSVVGLALPCMLSLEFIRNAPVSDNGVAALTAQGLSTRFPDYAMFWWATTLFVGFIVLAPNVVFGGDLVARLWTDLIWIGSSKVKERPGRSVSLVYYTILAIYGVWGLMALKFFTPLQLAKVGPILGNVGLGFSAFHTLYVNRTLLPKPLRPNLFMQFGLAACGVFFLSITAVVVISLLRG